MQKLESIHLPLSKRIDAAYVQSGNSLGWRLLYSPLSVLQSARVAFIGLNPGGTIENAAHSVLSTSSGSAYETESWAGHAPGGSPLQIQVVSLLKLVGQEPEQVLAGNLVPFRSRSWKHLKSPDYSCEFGTALWRDLLAIARPELVISMGGTTNEIVANFLGVKSITRVDLNWGNVTGQQGDFESGRFVGLPHLSRFKIVGRAASKVALRKLLFS